MTLMYHSIITAYTTDGQTFADRTPFICYLPSGKECIAVGQPRELVDLMSEQTEGQTEGAWKIVERKKEASYLESKGELGNFRVTFVIEPVVIYASTALHRKEKEDAEEADYEGDTL